MIIQVGVYPPPVGGVSIYMKRFKEYLDSSGIQNELWDLSSNDKNVDGVKKVEFKKVPLLVSNRKDALIAHYNISGILARNYIGFFNRFISRPKNITTIHGRTAALFAEDEKKMIRTLNSFDAVICVKENDKELLQSKGVMTRIYEIPAFIPPVIRKEEVDEIPQEVWNFVNTKNFVICANAFKLNFYKEEDLYGADLCVELCARLKREHPDIGFVFSLSNIGNLEYFAELRRRIIEYGIEDNFLFITDAYQFYPILMKSSLFVRPTNTDGDALSIREAVNLGVPALASDVVERPKGVSLFKNRDIDDFYAQAKNIIDNIGDYKKAINGLQYENNAEKIISVYKDITGVNYGC